MSFRLGICKDTKKEVANMTIEIKMKDATVVLRNCDKKDGKTIVEMINDFLAEPSNLEVPVFDRELFRNFIVGYLVDENGLAVDLAGGSLGEAHPGEFLVKNPGVLVAYDVYDRNHNYYMDIIDYKNCKLIKRVYRNDTQLVKAMLKKDIEELYPINELYKTLSGVERFNPGLTEFGLENVGLYDLRTTIQKTLRRLNDSIIIKKEDNNETEESAFFFTPVDHLGILHDFITREKDDLKICSYTMGEFSCFLEAIRIGLRIGVGTLGANFGAKKCSPSKKHFIVIQLSPFFPESTLRDKILKTDSKICGVDIDGDLLDNRDATYHQLLLGVWENVMAPSVKFFYDELEKCKRTNDLSLEKRGMINKLFEKPVF